MSILQHVYVLLKYLVYLYFAISFYQYRSICPLTDVLSAIDELNDYQSCKIGVINVETYVHFCLLLTPGYHSVKFYVRIEDWNLDKNRTPVETSDISLS
jgi:hypothetical protein